VRSHLAAAGVAAWLVGGTVRDLLRGSEPGDIDLATAAEPFGPARAFADAIGGSYFTLSEEFTACRVITRGGEAYDFQQLRGGSIEADLRERDFTVDAMALPLAGGGLIDPLGGEADLSAGRLSPVNDTVFRTDPLRLLRAVRLEKTLSLRLTGEAGLLVRRDARLAAESAAERQFSELTRIIDAPGTVAAIRRLDEFDLLEAVLPELAALKGISQNDFHHLDVFEHTLAAAGAMDDLIMDPAQVFPGTASAMKARLETPLAGDASRSQALILAALMHDIGKPGCRFTDEVERVRFFEHDRLSAELAEQVLGRFHASRTATGAVVQLVRQHMRLVGLINAGDVSERARVRYLRATHPYAPESVLLSVSDRLAVRGPASTGAAIRDHLEFAREMMARCFAAEEARPPRLVNGEELMAALGLEPGPLVGRLLEAIEEERALGNVDSREGALEFARRLAGGEDGRGTADI